MKKFISLVLTFTLIFGISSCSKSSKSLEQKAQFFTQLEDLVKKAENSSMEQIAKIIEQFTEFSDKNAKFMDGTELTSEEKERLIDLTKRFALSTQISEINYSDATDENITENNSDEPLFDMSFLDDFNYDDLELDDNLNFGESINTLIFGDDLSIGSSSPAPIVDDILGGLNLGGSSSSANDLGLSDLELPSFDFGDVEF